MAVKPVQRYFVVGAGTAGSTGTNVTLPNGKTTSMDNRVLVLRVSEHQARVLVAMGQASTGLRDFQSFINRARKLRVRDIHPEAEACFAAHLTEVDGFGVTFERAGIGVFVDCRELLTMESVLEKARKLECGHKNPVALSKDERRILEEGALEDPSNFSSVAQVAQDGSPSAKEALLNVIDRADEAYLEDLAKSARSSFIDLLYSNRGDARINRAITAFVEVAEQAFVAFQGCARKYSNLPVESSANEVEAFLESKWRPAEKLASSFAKDLAKLYLNTGHSDCLKLLADMAKTYPEAAKSLVFPDVGPALAEQVQERRALLNAARNLEVKGLVQLVEDGGLERSSAFDIVKILADIFPETGGVGGNPSAREALRTLSPRVVYGLGSIDYWLASLAELAGKYGNDGAVGELEEIVRSHQDDMRKAIAALFCLREISGRNAKAAEAVQRLEGDPAMQDVIRGLEEDKIIIGTMRRFLERSIS